MSDEELKPEDFEIQKAEEPIRFIHRDIFVEIRKKRILSNAAKAYEYVYRNPTKAFNVLDLCTKFNIRTNTFRSYSRMEKKYGRIFAFRYYKDDMFVAFIEEFDVAKLMADYNKLEQETIDAVKEGKE